MFEGFAEEAEC
jgi:hypothetical protein